MLTRQVELALQIGLDDLHIPQGHADVVVAEQLHQSGKTDTQADHLRGERVP
jgi:thiamine monophosphate synthase